MLEEREGSVGLARALFRRAIQADANNSVAWRSWAAMEERLGNAVRADELRSMRLQQVGGRDGRKVTGRKDQHIQVIKSVSIGSWGGKAAKPSHERAICGCSR